MIRYYKLLWKEILARLFFHLIYIIAIAALPYVIKNMIDCTYENGISDVIKWVTSFISFIIVGMAAQYITQKNAWKLDKKFYEAIRQDLFQVIISKNPESFYKKEIGEYSSMITNDVASCEEYLELIMEICESAIDLIVYAAFIFTLDTNIAIIIYTAAILVFFLPQITGKKLSDRRNALSKAMGAYTNTVLDLLTSFTFVDPFTLIPINQKHKKELHKMEHIRYSYGTYKTFANVLNGSTMYVVNIAAFAIIAILLSLGKISAGIATATISYIQDFMFPLRTIVDSSISLKAVSGVKDKIITEIKNERQFCFSRLQMKHNLTLKNINKKWDNFEIKNFSYTFEKGKSYVIVGNSGSGKSSLLKIITQHLKADSGYISIDGKEASYDMCNELIFYLNQDCDVYLADYRDNTTIFQSYEYKDFLNDTVSNKIYTSIRESENCNLLSGGEKQLVLIIRALLSKKEILVLDEPFSALNPELEREVTKELLRHERTIIMVTHNIEEEYLNLFDVVIQMGE